MTKHAKPEEKISMNHRLSALQLAALAVATIPFPASAAGTSFETAEAAVAEGNIAYAKGDLDAAAKSFEAAIAADPDQIEAMFYLGLINFGKGRFSEAAERLSPVVRAEPGNAAARTHLGISYFKLDKYDAALDQFRAAETIAPNAQVRLYSGLVMYRKGDRKAAAAKIDEAAGMDPSFKSSGEYLKAVMLMETGRGSEGIDALSKLAQADPGSPAGTAAAEVLRGPRPAESRRFSAGVELGSAYDSNVILQSNSGDVPLPVGISNEADLRTQLNANIGYALYSSKEWLGAASYRLYEGINSHLPKYNFHLHELRLSGAWNRGPVEASLPYSFAYAFVSDGYSGYSFTHGLAPSVTVKHGLKAATRFVYDVRFETFLETPVAPVWDRTGTGHKASLFEFYSPVKRVRLGLGYAFEFNDSKGAAWRYMAHHGTLLAAAEAWKGGRVDGSLGYAFRDFDSHSSDPASALGRGAGSPRQDQSPLVALSVTQALYRDWLEASLTYTGMVNRSNIPGAFYDWDRQVAGVAVRATY